jgi:hypothetical protein
MARGSVEVDDKIIAMYDKPMMNFVRPVLFVAISLLFSYGIVMDDSAKTNSELLFNILPASGFVFVGLWFALNPKSVDEKNKKEFLKLYDKTGLNFFKNMADSVQANPVNSLGGRVGGVSFAFLGFTILAKSLFELI